MSSPPRVHFQRSVAILRVRRRLERDSFPRLQMTFIVTLTAAMGLLASFLFLRAGIESMAMRYPIALVLAYVFFLFLIWLWLRTKASDYLDVPDLSGLPPGPGSGNIASPGWTGGGGQFGGGGASGSFAEPEIAAVSEPLSSVGDAVDTAASADEFAIPLVAIALAIGLAIASMYVIYIAPVLFAEVLVDGALSYALYRHLRGYDPEHWLVTAFRRTVIPFAATAIFLAVTGALMSAYAPGARSIGEVVRYVPEESGRK